MMLRTPRLRALGGASARALVAGLEGLAGIVGILGVAGLGATTASCAASRGAPAQTPVDLAIAPIGSVPDGGILTTGENASGRCALRLVASRIHKSSPGCYLDEHVNETAGLLHYPCGGDGPAEADFGEHRYAGRVTRGELELELTGELDWEDGCHWGTDAVIRGTLVANGEPTLKKLSWKYEDFVMTGTDCSGVCTARAEIDVSSATARTPEMPAADDDDED